MRFGNTGSGAAPSSGGAAVVSACPGDAELGASDNGVAGGVDSTGDTLGNTGGGAAPDTDEVPVASVRPSDAATEDAPIPGTVGSIKLAVPDAECGGIAPDVRLTSVVGGESGLAVDRGDDGAEPACDNFGSKPAGT